MVEVFKTNVGEKDQSKWLVGKLRRHFPESRINLDAEDCDRVLRVEAAEVRPEEVIELVTSSGFHCEILP
ncbi:hypothetical protein [Larkinella soli]|uniref:hypothetical protein n=1 Tax=Larkinella soli TaxID=1770527 RepID=UPI000FFBA034|nr:hypothetical protein [Larkinella soli]